MSQMSGHSENCTSAEEYWDRSQRKCRPCSEVFTISPGKEFTTNCGLSDDGGRHEPLHRDCSINTYNDGSFHKCQPCSICPSSQFLSPCNSTSNTQCCGEGQRAEGGECREPSTPGSTAATTDPTMTSTIYMSSEIVTSAEIVTTHFTMTNQTNTVSAVSPLQQHNHWILLPVFTGCILVCVCLMSVFYISKKRKQSCTDMKKCFSKGSMRNHVPLDDSCVHLKAGTEVIKEDINSFLSPEIQAAPLHSVLNNLDVVEELVLLLDPDTPGAKNTRHLAAKCSIPFTWINYAYSMKESRSPLIAVLERVIAKNPNCNVGHLADLLSNIGRNDAVAVLRNITLSEDV
ncbi:IGF-like family receptor 1 [Hoplias malabaricus]|uniref:IGF-like family receptor 1 n=1 Tax=Hoplias malabaricus TaxID=27720 RepID=UPI003462131B